VSTDVDVWTPATEDDTPGELVPGEGEEPTEFDIALTASTLDFEKMTAKAQNTLLFVLLRDMAGEQRALTDRLNAFEQEARELVSPESLHRIKNDFLASFPLLKGLF